MIIPGNPLLNMMLIFVDLFAVPGAIVYATTEKNTEAIKVESEHNTQQ